MMRGTLIVTYFRTPGHFIGMSQFDHGEVCVRVHLSSDEVPETVISQMQHQFYDNLSRVKVNRNRLQVEHFDITWDGI